jgi:hypothetical protein
MMPPVAGHGKAQPPKILLFLAFFIIHVVWGASLRVWG